MIQSFVCRCEDDEWSVEDGILTLSDDEKMGYPLVNHFLIDGERFTGTTILGKGK